MKYKQQLFDYAVKDYKRTLKDYSHKSITILLDIDNEHAFFSIAPLSQALHELHSDIYLVSHSKGNSPEFETLQKLWPVYKEYETNKRGTHTKYLSKFISEINKKSSKDLSKLFRPSSLVIKTDKSSFTAGKLKLPYKYKWHKPYRVTKLKSACKKVWSEVFDLKKSETIEINLPLLPPEGILKLPLEDYLDSYAIVWHLKNAAQALKAFPLLQSSTDRVSPIEPAERVGDLILTLRGCEYSKQIKNPIFSAYTELSKELKLPALKPSAARLMIRPQGFPGKHRFGSYIGYPTPNNKTKWTSPTSMFMKLEDYPQSQYEDRKPATRLALTETLPIDVFSETVNIDFKSLRKISNKLYDSLKGCILINVVSHENKKGPATNLIVDIANRKLIPDNGDVTSLVDAEALKRTKKYYGRYTNIPCGEVFLTPESMQGTFVGDVVIAVDRSIKLTEDEPIIVDVEDGRYTIRQAPGHILERIQHTKDAQMEVLKENEKNKTLPQELINQYKDNFNRIGEFAINTHPTARLCDYLVVNEKIARMMHIALGAGFESDRKTVYHFDIVFNAAKQKLDVYGVKPDGTEVWVLRKGRMVV